MRRFLLGLVLLAGCTRSNPEVVDEDLGGDVDLGSDDLSDQDLSEQDLSDQDLANPDFSLLDLAGVDLLGVDLTGGCVAGTACGGADVGGCRARILCVGMTPVCRGTYVDADNGNDSNPGTRALPLKTILAAQNNATLIGGGADVCACTGSVVNGSTWTEDVTMREGQSLIGGFQCGTWTRDLTVYTTVIEDTIHSGVKFPAGITVVTALDGFEVRGHDETAGTSAAITVTDSSPTLRDLSVSGGSAPTSYALHVIRSGGGAVASPTVVNGTYTAGATPGGTEHVAHLEGGAGGSFTDVGMTGNGGNGLGAPIESVALRCNTCGRVAINAVNVNPVFYGGAATTRSAGLWLTGNANLSAQGTNASAVRFEGNDVAGGSSPTSRGIYLENCAGNATFDLVNVIGGFGATATNVGVDVLKPPGGGNCNATFTNSGVRGCGTGTTCIGVRGDGSSANVSVSGGDITGAAQTEAATTATFGVQCLNGGCTGFNRVIIDAGRAPSGAGVQLSGSSPFLNSNRILAPSCAAGGTPGVLSGLHLLRSSARVTNNVISDATCAGNEDVVRFEKVNLPVGTLPDSQMVNNTIEYTPCTACGERRGLSVKGVPLALGGGTPLPAVINNIMRTRGAGGTTWPVFEYDIDSSMSAFNSNDLYDPTAQALFRYHGALNYTITDVNDMAKLAETNGKNISADPLLNGTWHMGPTSPCRNAGVMPLAPQIDFDNQTRPNATDAMGVAVDIGADEFYP